MQKTKTSIAILMRQHAEMIQSKAAKLFEYADMLDESDESTFMTVLGDEHAGPRWMRQINDEIRKASEVRPSDTFQLDVAMLEVFTRAQRASVAR